MKYFSSTYTEATILNFMYFDEGLFFLFGEKKGKEKIMKNYKEKIS
jgi:hypothetical protein